MNARNFSPINIGDKVLPSHPRLFTQTLEAARAQPDHEAMDWTSEHAQTVRAVPADPDDVFSQDEDYDDAMEVRELLSQRPASTPNGKTFGLLQDALATIQDLQRAIGGLDFFSAGDTGLGEAQRVAEKAKEVLMRAGVRHG